MHDLRRFHCPADRAAVYEGYVAEAAVSWNFEQTWRVACVLAAMLAVVQNKECRAAALDELSALVEHMR